MSEVALIDPKVAEAGGLSKFLGMYAGNFGRVVPAHIPVEAFVGLAAAYVHRSPQLTAAAQANPAALITALRECAMLGHFPGKDTFVLVPFRSSGKNRHPSGWDISGIEVYKGTIERMYRSGAVGSVHARVVRQHDVFDADAVRAGVINRHTHTYPWDADPADRGPLVGVYAWADLTTGARSDVALLNRFDIARYRAVSKAGDSFWGPSWPAEGPWTQDMWKKTAFHRLEPIVPTSSQYRMEVAQAGAGAVGWQGVPEPRTPTPGVGGDPDVHDAEIVDETPSDGADWPATASPGSGTGAGG